MSGLANTMTNSTGGICRLWCEKCKAETQHKGATCGCGTVHRAYPVRTLTQYLRNSINLPGSGPIRKRWNGSTR
jgi:hypothetical protein